jgi:RHS repeat-associated protein
MTEPPVLRLFRSLLASALCLIATGPTWAQVVALPSGNPSLPEEVRFYHVDALGSVRAISDIDGEIVARKDYLPLGEEIDASIGSRDQVSGYGEEAGNKHQFTGKERDLENGLDYFGARYYSGAQGRFTSADPSTRFDRAIASPQQWNRYGYVSNNPLRKIDPNGADELDLAVGWVQGIGQALFGAAMATGALIESRGMPSHETMMAGLAAVEHAQALGRGLSNLGDMRDQYVQMSVSGNDADQRALGQAIGQGTAVAALTLAPFAKAGPANLAAGRHGFSASDVNPTGSLGNCVNCAIAGDATLAGHPAVAMPGGATPIHTLETTFGARFVAMSGRQAIESRLSALGPGARGIVYASRGGTGHVFNVVNQRGTVRFIDFQRGTEASFDGYTLFALLRTH